jgi:hypothetical protein
MAAYTVVQLKDLTSVAAVATWSDDKILVYQQMAENVLSGLNMDTTMSGYSLMYPSAVLAVFDWLADNPTALRAKSQGKVSKTFSDILPPGVRAIVDQYVKGSSGSFGPANFERTDVGLR